MVDFSEEGVKSVDEHPAGKTYIFGFRIEVIVDDGNDSPTFVLSDEAASKITGTTAEDSRFKTVEEGELKSLHPNLTPEELAQEKRDQETCDIVFCVGLYIGLLGLMVYYIILTSTSDHLHKNLIPEIKIVSIDFAAELNDNSTTTQQSHYLPDLVSARWDLLIRVPGKLVGDYMCLQGNLQASFLYKNVTLVTSSIQSYNKLELGTPQLLNVSAVATKEDLNGAIGKEIMDAIKERNEVWFGSRLSLTDCREKTEKGMMSYECDEAKLQFEPGFDQIKATTFGNHPTCIINV